MDDVTESTMAIESTFNSIVNEIQMSNLNFAIQLTPFSAYITLKKSTVTKKNGKLADPSPPVFMLFQKSSQDLCAAQEEISRLSSALKISESKCEEVIRKNLLLSENLKSADEDLLLSRETNENLLMKIEAKDKELDKLLSIKKDIESKFKHQKADHAAILGEADAQCKAMAKTIKAKEKEIHNIHIKLSNSQDKIANLKGDISEFKAKESKLERSLKTVESKLLRLQSKTKQVSFSSQTDNTIDTPYAITDKLPPIFGSKLCTLTRPVFISNSVPNLATLEQVEVNEDDLTRDAAEEALSCVYDGYDGLLDLF